MQNTRSIIRQPIMAALLLSVAVHAAMLYSRGIHVPPTPKLETGRTVVQLTLLPSMPAPAVATEPQPATPAETAKESQPPPVAPLVEPSIQPLHKPDTQPATKAMEETPRPASIEQDATMEQAKGVATEASTTGAFRPAYPRISRKRGEEGTVVLAVQVLANGSVGKVSILHSSGFRRLDDAAINGAKQTSFSPALRFGRAIDSTTQLSYTFRLNDD